MSSDQPIIDDNAWVRGETEELHVTLTDTDGNGYDASTFIAIEFQVKKSAGDADPAVLSLALGSGIVVLAQVGADLGAIKVTVSAVQTYAIPPGCWHYDVWVTKADGSRKCAIGPSIVWVRDPVNLYP